MVYTFCVRGREMNKRDIKFKEKKKGYKTKEVAE